EAVFTLRAVRRYRPDPIPLDDLRLLVEAAVRAANGGNQQLARLLLVVDRGQIERFGPIYREAWWAKRRDEGFHRFEDLPPSFHPNARLADHMSEVPCVVFALGLPGATADSVIPAVQNLLLAARALGIGSVPTTLHPSVLPRFRALFGIPDDVGFHLCVPLGYPVGRFGPNARRPTSETTFWNGWGGPGRLGVSPTPSSSVHRRPQEEWRRDPDELSPLCSIPAGGPSSTIPSWMRGPDVGGLPGEPGAPRRQLAGSVSPTSTMADRMTARRTSTSKGLVT
ncbi:MAG TPA: nitroreductase family protein, partial [Acidimicrobiales bacterium]|nr:nitroreductase family protein [Acidimicrobiales bacterium]